MRGLTRPSRVAALVAAAALVVTACGGGDEGEKPGGAGGDTYSMQVNNPENPLIPGTTNESEGSQIIEGLWTGLVQYDDDTNLAYTGVAQSIESDDRKTWTVKLKDGWTFHDGTPVNADSFVKAWNYTAYSPNAQDNSYFFSNIEGYDDLQAPTDAKGNPTGKPKAKELSGLKKVDDLTFTVRLTSPFAQFPLTTGYNAFYPLPEAFYKDPEAFGKKPIGNGPFKADTEFVQGQGITLSRYDDYAGEDKAKAAGVEIRVYQDINTAYTDVEGGNLDVTDEIPTDAQGSVADEFGDRYVERPEASYNYIGFPIYDKRWADKRVRHAFSMAIDRDTIADKIFQGARTPAFSTIPDVISGHRDDACEYCRYDPKAAKALLAQTDFDTSEPVELWFNAGADHGPWMQAVGNMLRDAFGVEYKLRGDLDFDQYLPKGDAKGFTGPFRLGWVMDYPSMQNFLQPLFSKAALPPNGSNSTFWVNEDFEKFVKEGNAAASDEQAVAAYQKAEDVLLEEMPITPIFFGKAQAVHSERVGDVKLDAFSRVQLADVTVAG
jgi:oligopeptide transport system substrate-binding protein